MHKYFASRLWLQREKERKGEREKGKGKRGNQCHPSNTSAHFENGQQAASFPACLRKSSTFRIISHCQCRGCASHAKVSCISAKRRNISILYTHIHLDVRNVFLVGNFMKMFCKLNENILTMRWQWRWRWR